MRVSAIAPDVLFRGAVDDPALGDMIAAVGQAHGVIIVTPIYKAAYSGLLKCFLDVLQPSAAACRQIAM